MKSKPLFLHDDLDKYFYNRKDELDRINYYIGALSHSLPQQLLLTGYRGVGKSYLLKKVVRETEPNIICVYLDISQIYAMEEGELTNELVLIELLKSMNQAIIDGDYASNFKLKVNQLLDNLKLKNYDFRDVADVFNIPIPNVETDYGKLSRFVMEFPQKIVDAFNSVDGFVIIFDEFQLLRKIKDLDKLFWLIRSFNQTQHNVSYIFTGSMSRTSDIIEQLNGETGAFGGRMIQMNIEPFSKDQTRSYFRDCMSEIKFTDEGFERFYQCTRGIPSYINSFYNVMDSSQLYDEDLVKETFFNNMDQILVMWLRIWFSLMKFEKIIVMTLVDEDGLTWSQLLEKSGVSRGSLNKYLTSLKDKGIVEYRGNEYYIEDQMLKTWLKHEKEVNGFYPI